MTAAGSLRDEALRSLRDGAELRLRLIDVGGDLVVRAAETVHRALQQGGKVVVFGNGGSAADAQHIAAEFVGRFVRDRVPLPALALTTDTSALTAIGNDFGFEELFARQIRALGRAGDVAIAITTSGRSPNVVRGVMAARQARMLSAHQGDAMKKLAAVLEVFITISVLAYFAYATFVTVYPVA